MELGDLQPGGARTRISVRQLAAALALAILLTLYLSRMGLPATIQFDQGSEFVSRELDLWAYQRGVTLDFSRPGKPTDNAFIEAFNSRFRAECLNAHWSLSLADAREKMEDWRRYYNEERPHGAIGHKPPIMLLNSPWRSQPAIVSKPENSSFRRSKDGSHSNHQQNSTHRWMKVGAQVKARFVDRRRRRHQVNRNLRQMRRSAKTGRQTGPLAYTEPEVMRQ